MDPQVEVGLEGEYRVLQRTLGDLELMVSESGGMDEPKGLIAGMQGSAVVKYRVRDGEAGEKGAGLHPECKFELRLSLS